MTTLSYEDLTRRVSSITNQLDELMAMAVDFRQRTPSTQDIEQTLLKSAHLVHELLALGEEDERLQASGVPARSAMIVAAVTDGLWELLPDARRVQLRYTIHQMYHTDLGGVH